MSVTSFLRRMSVDSDPPKTSSRPSREGRDSPRKATSRRSRLVASIDSARRRFSLQHSHEVFHQLSTTALSGKNRLDISSLPNLEEVGL
ncbi:unnamed protein product [Heligmosomoides polygyrus]|uniref:3',5'-cyclic-AMP phosphodiesterase n=1 Tax=Heligmosomoides polygyrus TaxID=6339 RepID=A0A183GCM8_HELPZ|nr:unnamed protein product [Heligmosomoides polygyrus]